MDYDKDCDHIYGNMGKWPRKCFRCGGDEADIQFDRGFEEIEKAIERGKTMNEFKRGDLIQFRGADSYFVGRFLCYVDKLEWVDDDGDAHGEIPSETRRCLVQQDGTGMVFIKPEPTEENRP